MSCIHPMFHLWVKPSPPRCAIAGHARATRWTPRPPAARRDRRRGSTPARCCRNADRLEVLAAAELVGDPLAGLPRVVEVEHRGDGVHAQPVDVELAQPVERVAHQERPHLVPAVVEDERAPVLVLALPRIGVLVEGGAVEAGQPVRVLREMAGHPVEHDAEAGLVTGVDQRAEVVGACRSGWSARRSRSPGSPTTR